MVADDLAIPVSAVHTDPGIVDILPKRTRDSGLEDVLFFLVENVLVLDRQIRKTALWRAIFPNPPTSPIFFLPKRWHRNRENASVLSVGLNSPL